MADSSKSGSETHVTSCKSQRPLTILASTFQIAFAH